MRSIESIHDVAALRMLLECRNKDNGYAPLDGKRMQNVVLHFLNRLGPISPTSLNKLLFYADFLAYRRHAMAISGLSYRALPYGPVPNNWKYLPLIEGVDQQEADMGTLLSANLAVDYNDFSFVEIEVLNHIVVKFKGKSASALSALSHQEEAWIKSQCDVQSPISFDYAFSLKAL